MERWAEFVGVPADSPAPSPSAASSSSASASAASSPKHTSFVLFSDPRFSQLYNILEGLDYSFPRAAKLGAWSGGNGRLERGGDMRVCMARVAWRGGNVQDGGQPSRGGAG